MGLAPLCLISYYKYNTIYYKMSRGYYNFFGTGENDSQKILVSLSPAEFAHYAGEEMWASLICHSL